MKTRIKREYKDRVFKMLFSDKRNLLSLYNAINETSYTDEDALEVNTLEDAIYMNMRNDLSFLLDCRLNLYEQQSTANPNMPLRGFMYCASLYSKLYGDKVHSTKLVKIHTPQMVVFYNGKKEAPEREVLRLSDAFMKQPEAEFPVEFTALALNINSGNNEQIIQGCETLAGYVMLVSKVREFSAAETGENANEIAVIKAVDWCIEHGYIAEFLIKHKREVIDMLLTEYNAERVRELDRADGYEEGYDEGHSNGYVEGVAKGVSEGVAKGVSEERAKTIGKFLQSGKDTSYIAEFLEISLEEVEKYAAELDMRSK